MTRHRSGESASVSDTPPRLILVDGTDVDAPVDAVAAGGIPVREQLTDDGTRLIKALLIQSRRRRDGEDYEEGELRDLQIAKGHRERVWWLLGLPEKDPWTVKREIRQELGVHVAVGGLVAVYHRWSDKYNSHDELVGKELKQVRIHNVTLVNDNQLPNTDERKEWAAISGRGSEATYTRMRYPEELDVVRMIAAAHMAIDEVIVNAKAA